jgi:hypothetical protein
MTEFITDIPVEDVDIEQLTREAASVPGLLCIVSGGGLVVARFDGQSQDQIEAFVDILDQHQPGSKHVKMWRYIERRFGMSRLDPPFDVDYITQSSVRLHPTNSIVVDGEIRRVDYYATAAPPNSMGIVEYSDLIVREDFAYTRDQMGFARARTQTITWFREDGSPHQSTKQRVKFYENDESLREGQRRRRNITDTLSMTVTGWLVATQTQLASGQARIQMGRDFMAAHKQSFDMYADASDAGILYAIRDDQAHAWLDGLMAPGLTVRAKILDDLNIWNLTL